MALTETSSPYLMSCHLRRVGHTSGSSGFPAYLKQITQALLQLVCERGCRHELPPKTLDLR